jgi:threonine aldolase
MHEIVDLRSDTVTRPTLEMRRAMAEAEVGDDVYDDDPTVNRLQEMAAALMGKEAGLLVPSGTMSNAIAIKVHTRPGDEILLDAEAHSMLYEVGLPATLAQVLTRQFHSVLGVPNVDEIAASIHTESLHGAGTTLLVLENTHNRAGGTLIPLEIHRQLQQVAREHGLRLHLDGARLFNAAVASGVPAREIADCTDTVTFCLSKGLGAPVGSVLCGDAEFIHRARRVRKMLGGGMRQAGILAAAGIHALEHHVARLADDHMRARRLAQGIAHAPGIVLDTVEPPTNMVYFSMRATAHDFKALLAEKHRVLCGSTASHRIRMVTHLDIDDEDIERAVEAVHIVGSKLL